MRDHVARLTRDRAQPSHDELATAVLYADIAIGQLPPDDATAAPAPDRGTLQSQMTNRSCSYWS